MTTEAVARAVVTVVTSESAAPTYYVVPAYTRRYDELRDMLHTYVDAYVDILSQHEAEASCGDFGFFMLSQAEREPFYKENPQ